MPPEQRLDNGKIESYRLSRHPMRKPHFRWSKGYRRDMRGITGG